jgi:hypothetical protein
VDLHHTQGHDPIIGTATATVVNGQAPFTYNWARTGGTTNVISVSNAGQQTATFSANLGWGANTNEQFKVDVRDAQNRLATASVTVNFTSPPQLTCSLSAASISATRQYSGYVSTGAVTVAAGGGTGGYTYQWVNITGSTVAVASGQWTNSATFGATLNHGTTVTETVRVTVRDSANNAASCDVAVTLIATAMPALAISVPPSVTKSVGSGVASVSVTVTVTAGGAGGLSFVWTKLSGDAISVSGGQTATFSGTPTPPATNCDQPWPLVAVFRVTVTDAIGQVVTGDITVNLYATQPGMILPECPLARVRPQ